MLHKLFFILCLFGVSICQATTPVRVNNGVAQNIDVFSNCQKITNASGKDIMVPTNTNGEWTAFLGNLPAGVSKAATCSQPVWVNTQVHQISGSTSNTVTKPTGLAVGDLMIAFIFENSVFTNISPPSGFTMTRPAITKDGGTYYSATYTKIADASDVAASNFSFTKTTNFLDSGVVLSAYRNVNSTTPIQDNSQSLNTPASTTITFGSVTSTNDGSLIVAIGEGGTAAPGLPTGFSSRFNNDATYGTRVSDKVLTPAGSTGVITATQTSQTSIGRLFVLNPP